MWMRRTLGRAAEGDDLERRSQIGGILPWLAVLAVILSGVYVRLGLGHWPRVYRDSPEFPLTGAAAVVAMLAVLSCPAMVGVGLLLPIVRAALRARPVFNRWVFSCWLGTIFLWLLATTDPYGFLEWAFD